jgi:hypothetical protein
MINKSLGESQMIKNFKHISITPLDNGFLLEIEGIETDYRYSYKTMQILLRELRKLLTGDTE